MKKSLIVASVIVLTVSNMVFAMSMQSLSKSQMMKTVQDKTLTTIPLVTLNGEMVNNTVTVYFDKNGTLKGQFATKPDNDPQMDQGKYMIKSDGTLCATWQQWNQSKPICVMGYELKNSLVFVNKDNHKLETVIMDSDIKAGDQVN